MKNIFKKICCLTLCSALCIGCLFTYRIGASAESYSDEVYEAMEVLRLFSVIPNYYDYNTDLLADVSRADFAVAVAKAINLTQYTGKPYYYDVSEQHWAYSEICALTDMGALGGIGNKLFRPDDAILKTEAYKIILSVLGYSMWADYNGGYPAGYIAAAKNAEISSGLSSSESLNMGDMLLLLYHACNTKIIKPVSYSDGGSFSYTTEGNETILSMYHDVYCERGILDGVNKITFGGIELGAGEVQIDKSVYKTDLDLSEYLGERIQFYYERTKSSDIGRVIWAKRYGTSGNTLYVDVNNDASFDKSGFILSYTDKSGRKRSAAIDRGAVVIYNGSVTGESLTNILNRHKYNVKLVKNSLGKYETVIVRCYENYYVGSVNIEHKTVIESGEGLKTRELDLNESNYNYLSLSLYGTEKGFEDIKPGMVLSVFRSLDLKYADVHIISETVSGHIDLVSEENSGKTFTINNKKYFKPSGVYDDSVSAGQDVTAHLDEAGDIAYMRRNTGSDTAAYIFKLALKSGAFGDEVVCKALNSQGLVQRLGMAKKVTIDGRGYDRDRDAEKIYQKLLTNGEFVPIFTLMKVNSNGEITMIDTINSDICDNNDVLKNQVSYKTNVAYNSGSFENYAVVNDGTVIFFVPTDDSIDSAPQSFFRVGKRASLTNWIYYNFESYTTTERTGYEQFVVVKGADQASERNRGSNLPVLVESFGKTINSEGNETYFLHGYCGAEETEIVLGEGVYESVFADKINCGDVIRIAQDANGELCLAEKVFDIEAPTINITAYNSVYGESKGYIYDVTDGVMRISKSPSVYESGSRAIYTDGVPCLIYDKTQQAQDKKIYYGNVSQARTYLDFGDECSMVYEMQARGIPKMFVIYLYQQ